MTERQLELLLRVIDLKVSLGYRENKALRAQLENELQALRMEVKRA